VRIRLPPAVLLAFVLTLLAGPATANVHVSPLEGWRSLHTGRISVQYRPEQRALAEQVLAEATQLLPQIEALFDWRVSTHLYINVIDRQDDPNGWATPLPFNHVTVYTTPPTRVGELAGHDRWLRLLLAHELTHTVHLDKANGAPLGVRRVLGRFPLLFPNAFQPDVLTEGLATWVETDHARGFGRGQGALFDLMMRTEVDSGLLTLGEAQQYRSEWPLNHAYLYGVYFWQFVEERHGAQAVRDWVDDYSGNLVPFLLSTSSRRVAGQDFDVLWNDYLAWLTQRFGRQIAAVHAAGGPTPFTPVTAQGYAGAPPVVLPDGRLVLVEVGLTGPSWLVLREHDGSSRRLTRVQADARPVAVHGDAVYFLQDTPCDERRLYSELFVTSLANRSSSATLLGNALALDHARQLSDCGRIVHAALSRDGATFALVQNDGGVQRLLLQDAAFAQPARSVWQGDADHYLADPAWIDADTLVVSAKAPDRQWSLALIDTRDGSLSSIALDLPPGNRQSPIHDPARDALFFSADHSGTVEIYRQQRGGQPERVTRSLSGSAQPRVQGDALYFLAYTPQGWDIARADANGTVPDDMLPELPVARGVQLKASGDAPAVTDARDARYFALPSALPRSWFLAAYGSGDTQELGITVNGNDALYFHRYVAGIAWDLNLEKANGALEYIAWNHLQFGFRRSHDITGNGEDPADPDFAVTLYSRSDDATATLFATLPFAFSRVTPFAGYSASEDRWFSNLPGVRPTIPLARIRTRGAGLVYESGTQFLHGISESHGRRVKLAVEQDALDYRLDASLGLGPTASFEGDVQSLDWREYLPLGGRHVLALRGFAGRGDNGADPFRLGDHFSLVQFTAPYVHERDVSLRGYQAGAAALTGNNAELLGAEWRIPLPAINRGIAGWPLGAHTASLALFAEGGRAWGTWPGYPDAASAPWYRGAGIEASLVVDLGYSLLPMLVRVGAARAMDELPGYDGDTVYATLGTSW
jgi:hypothetical protein